MNEFVLSVLKSKNKQEVLLIIAQKKQIMQSQIIKNTKLYASHLSRTLKYLRDNKLIICENPTDLNYKVYKITPLGNKINKEIERILPK